MIHAKLNGVHALTALAKKEETQKKNVNEKWYPGIKAQFGELTKFYHITEEINRGAYGVVYAGYILNPEETHEPSAKKVAIKAFFHTGYLQLVYMELNVLKLVKGCSYFLQLMDFMMTGQQLFIMTEFFENECFEKFMCTANMREIKYYMYSLLEGLAKLHSMGIVHRDMKPSNFLYNTKERKGIIVDFGMAEISPEMREKVFEGDDDIPNREIYENLVDLQCQLGQNKIGTPGFMPVEQMFKVEEQSYEVDMWSAGVMFLHLLTKKPAIFRDLRLKDNDGLVDYSVSFVYELGCIFGRKKTQEVVAQCDFLAEFPSNVPEHQISWDFIVNHPEINQSGKDLLDKMLRISPKERISAQKALEHPFFNDIQK